MMVSNKSATKLRVAKDAFVFVFSEKFLFSKFPPE
jgi:hypothetical protein